MKKWIWILVAVCLIAVVGIAAFGAKDGSFQAGDPSAVTLGPAAGDRFTTLYAAHQPGETVMKVGGEEIDWNTYIGTLTSLIAQQESQMAYYGTAMDWSTTYDAEGHTYADLVLDQTENTLKQLIAVEKIAAENGGGLTEADKAEMAANIEQILQHNFGEGATEEELNAYLAERYMSRTFYDRMISQNYLLNNTFNALYGENGEKLSDEEALAYLKENNYVYASHILFLNTDENGEPLSDEAREEKLETAQKLLDELKSIRDQEKLVSRFAELKQEYCEDGGKISYPDGYLFQAGQGVMVQPFEDGILSVGEYELAELVESDYGWHIILRLPLDPDAPAFDPYGSGSTARVLAAEAMFNERLDETAAAQELTYAEGFSRPDLLGSLLADK